MRRCSLWFLFFFLLIFLVSCKKEPFVTIYYKDGIDVQTATAMAGRLDMTPGEEAFSENEREVPDMTPGEEALSENEREVYLQLAEQLLDDPLFSAYFEAYSAEATNTESALIAAILAYLNIETTAEERAKQDENASNESTSDYATISDDVVYYTEKGGVWHKDRMCSSLKKSKNVLSGTVEEAENAGKSNPCKLCSQ